MASGNTVPGTAKNYYGTKRVTAWPESKPTGVVEQGQVEERPGYAVLYPDGYRSWSPKDVFEAAYHPVDAMDFSGALAALKEGRKLARKGWKNVQFIVMMPALHLPPYNTQDTARKVSDRTAKFIGDDKPLDCQPYVACYTADEKWVPGWLCSQGDLFAEDWMVVEDLPMQATDGGPNPDYEPPAPTEVSTDGPG